MMKEYDMPCCCVQDEGVEKRIRAPQDSQAIVSVSTLIQPLLAQFTALTTYKRHKKSIQKLVSERNKRSYLSSSW